MKKFNFFSKRFTTSFSGFSKKGLGLMVVLVGVVVIATLAVAVQRVQAHTKPTDCGAAGYSSTDGACVVDQSKMELNCACNYTYTCKDSTGLIQGSVNVKCPTDQNLVCSNREDVGSTGVVRYTDGDKVLHDWFCYYKVGSGSTCQKDQDCEAGGICKGGVCEADIGAGVVSGLFGKEVSDIRDTIRMFINIGLGFLGVLTVIFIIYGGILWLTAAGNEEKVSKGKNTLMWAAIGAIVISIAWTISSYVLQIGKTVG